MQIKTTPQVSIETGINQTYLQRYAKQIGVKKIGNAWAWTPTDIVKVKFLNHAAQRRLGK